MIPVPRVWELKAVLKLSFRGIYSIVNKAFDLRGVLGVSGREQSPPLDRRQTNNGNLSGVDLF